MATNKNALIRYRTIDKCLQNRSKKWTLADLIEACSDALYEFEGKHTSVSKRTVQLDIQMMRSNKLGYNAPIVVRNKKFYCYEEEDYSITDIPLTQIDMEILTESVEMLKQFKDFSLFSELNGVIQKLEDKVYRESNDKTPIIYMEKNENLKGLNYLDQLYQAIIKKIVLKIAYQSFKAERPSTLIFHGYILKEFNNRWFLVGREDGKEKISTLALDRIMKLDLALSVTYKKEHFDAAEYYKDTYGVSVHGDKDLIEVQIKVDAYNTPYVLTKPFHHSQKVLKKFADGSVIIYLKVHHNFELERLFLGFGEAFEILKPRRLRNKIQSKLKAALERYE